ncbi:MAG: hypothetical protein Q8M94_12105 [Ignavibacteria bacterium]|nr:hypothetical protein [Ignavibacteria bacterium]
MQNIAVFRSKKRAQQLLNSYKRAARRVGITTVPMPRSGKAPSTYYLVHYL